VTLNRNFKMRVRDLMQETGLCYTAARQRLLEKEAMNPIQPKDAQPVLEAPGLRPTVQGKQE